MSVTPEIVLGPPGTGKTTALLTEVEAELSRGTPPDRIGFVTFTRRAAEEAASRAVTKFGLDRDALPYFRTLHSLCYRALGLRRGDVLDGRRLQGDFADFAGLRITGRWGEDGTFSGYEQGDRLLFRENLARVRGISLEEQYRRDSDGLPWRELERTARALAAFKAAHGLLDYTDMLTRFVAEGAPPRLDVLFVDEGQDIFPVAWAVVWLLARRARRVIIAGDDDQAIYNWAGADAATLIEMDGAVRVLGHSHRCPAAVQGLALDVIRGVSRRRPKAWSPRVAGGAVTRATRLEDCDLGGDWGDGDGGNVQPVLILARNEYVLAERVDPELRLRGVLYERGGRLSVAPAVLAAVVTWEGLRAGGEATAREVRGVYRWMAPGEAVDREHAALPGAADGEVLTLADLRARHGLRTDAMWRTVLSLIPPEEKSYLLACLRSGERLRHPRPRVRVSTIHGSKGGEAHHVVVLREMAARTHREMRAEPDDERRVWYVAATRARERLTIVGGNTQMEVPWL